MSKELSVRIRNKIDTSANWATNNPVLLNGEIGIESDTNKIKVGNGTTNWNNLEYISGGTGTIVLLNGTPQDTIEFPTIEEIPD